MGESWLIAVSIGIVALAFLALVIYLIVTLVSLRKTIDATNEKIHTFDPLFRTVDRVGEAIEKRTGSVRQLSEEVEEEEYRGRRSRKSRTIDTALEVAEWALVGLAIWNKMKERR
ncbi:MAG: hypothetical protein K940chlam9_00298 [Chlamydiae bacterium]|nr:hypothetical protein [Chlamydiota bacterium]